MAGRTTAGKRYAQAIANLARQQQSWEQWRRDLNDISGLLARRPEVRLTLQAPRVSVERKLAVLTNALEQAGHTLRPETNQLFTVMARRGRLDLLTDVAEWFDELADRALGVKRVRVTSAVPLGDQQRQQLQRRLGGGQGQVLLDEHVDPSILGGLIIREEDVIRDYSVRARLESLRERLS